MNLICDYQVITQSRGKRGLMGKVPANAVNLGQDARIGVKSFCTHLTASSCDSIDGNGRNIQFMTPRSSNRQR